MVKRGTGNVEERCSEEKVARLQSENKCFARGKSDSVLNRVGRQEEKDRGAVP